MLALGHRVATGNWDAVAQPSSLDQVVSGLGLGPARFTDYHPAPLTGRHRALIRLKQAEPRGARSGP